MSFLLLKYVSQQPPKFLAIVDTTVLYGYCTEYSRRRSVASRFLGILIRFWLKHDTLALINGLLIGLCAKAVGVNSKGF